MFSLLSNWCVSECQTFSKGSKCRFTYNIPWLKGSYQHLSGWPPMIPSTKEFKEFFFMNSLSMLHSLPFFESSILISSACSRAHLYLSSPIHNSNRNLKDQLSCYFDAIRQLPALLVWAGWGQRSTAAVSLLPGQGMRILWDDGAIK